MPSDTLVIYTMNKVGRIVHSAPNKQRARPASVARLRLRRHLRSACPASTARGYNPAMGQREFLIYLDPDKRQNRYRHSHSWEGSKVVEFCIQFEALIDGKWVVIVCYDTAHGRSHRDIMHPNSTETKEWLDLYSNAVVLTIGQRDIMENWPAHRKQFEKELRK
jgi:hypothetical protein